jgi:hypothetical protein
MKVETMLSRMQRLLIISVLVFGVLRVPATAYAEIIVDDFNDPAEVVSPGMFDEFITTADVGPLNATRRMRLAGSQGNPQGSLDSEVTTSSVLTGRISSLNPTPFGSTRALVQSQYDFTPTDFTEGGRNNAIFFDFRQVTSQMQPSLFRIRLDDNSDFYFHFDLEFPVNPAPFTVGVAFDEFRPRGGPSLLDATSVKFLDFQLWASSINGGGPDPLNFFMQLDRIRVGRIPEPSSSAMVFAGLYMLFCARRQNRNAFYGG